MAGALPAQTMWESGGTRQEIHGGASPVPIPGLNRQCQHSEEGTNNPSKKTTLYTNNSENATADHQWDIISDVLPFCFLTGHTCAGGWVFAPHYTVKVQTSTTAPSMGYWH